MNRVQWVKFVSCAVLASAMAACAPESSIGSPRCSGPGCRASDPGTVTERDGVVWGQAGVAPFGVLSRSDGKVWVAALIAPTEIVVVREAFEVVDHVEYSAASDHRSVPVFRAVKASDALTYAFEIFRPSGVVDALRVVNWETPPGDGDGHAIAIAHLRGSVNDIVTIDVRATPATRGEHYHLTGFDTSSNGFIVAQGHELQTELVVTDASDAELRFTPALPPGARATDTCSSLKGGLVIAPHGETYELVGILMHEQTHGFDPCREPSIAVPIAANTAWLWEHGAERHPGPVHEEMPNCTATRCDECLAVPSCKWWARPGGQAGCEVDWEYAESGVFGTFSADEATDCGRARRIFDLARGACESNAQCQAPARCVDGRCAEVEACSVDDDCDRGRLCEAGHCSPGPDACTGDWSDCGDGGSCLSGICVTIGDACTSTASCSSGAECMYGTCPSWPCHKASDCGISDSWCTDGFCRMASCTSDGDCPSDAFCRDGGCMRDPTGRECDSDEWCGEGFFCDAGHCLANGF